MLHWFKWNIQIMWYPEPYLDSIITKYCDLIQECLFLDQQGVPDNHFNVCEELMFSRTFRKNSTERNKQDLNSQLNDIFITNQCYSFHFKDQKVLYKWNSSSCFSTKVKALKRIKGMKAIMTKMKQYRRYLKMKTPECCAFQQQFLGPPSSSLLFCC